MVLGRAEDRNESRKILGLPDLRVPATCVRVPVVTTHSVAVHAVFGREVERAAAQRVLGDAPGLVLTDDPERGEFPTPADAVGTDPTWVGGYAGPLTTRARWICLSAATTCVRGPR